MLTEIEKVSSLFLLLNPLIKTLRFAFNYNFLRLYSFQKLILFILKRPKSLLNFHFKQGFALINLLLFDILLLVEVLASERLPEQRLG